VNGRFYVRCTFIHPCARRVAPQDVERREMIKATFAYAKYALSAITAVAFTVCPS
jgi:hypothetical protein